MNVKQGDLAVVKMARNPANLGRYVHVVKLSEFQWVNYPEGRRYGVVWDVEPALIAHDGTPTSACLDEYLRPINGGHIDAKENDALFSTNPIVRKETA
jgi:hypothetical protein